MATKGSTRKPAKYRYRLFGMAGTWSEYSLVANRKKDLYGVAFDHLKFGHDAHIEDAKTGKWWTLGLKQTFKYTEPQC